MKKYRRYNLENCVGGYFTVEAAMLMPIVCVVILLVVYLWFFQYNRCLMEQDVGALALRGAVMQTEDNEERMENLRSQADAIYRDKYVAWKYDEAELEIGHGTVSVKQTGGIQIPFGIPGSNETMAEYAAICENHLLNPVIFVRSYRKLTGGE